MTHFLKKRRNDRNGKRVLARRGTTSVEFAIVAPVFVFVIAVCGEFARLSMMRNLAQNAAYEAARYVMAEGAKVNDGIARANQILARLGTKNATITINGSTGAVGPNGQVINEISAATTSVSCNIEIPLASNSAIIPPSFLGNKIVVSGMTLRTERYRGYYDGQSTN